MARRGGRNLLKQTVRTEGIFERLALAATGPAFQSTCHSFLATYEAGSEAGVHVAAELLEKESPRERLADPALPVRKAIGTVEVARG